MCCPCNLEHLCKALTEPQWLFWGAPGPSLAEHSLVAAAFGMQKCHPESASYRKMRNWGQIERRR